MSRVGRVAVLGAGPAGSVLAATLARIGHETHLYEKDDFPRDKLCGEFLSSEARSLLSRIGVWSEVAALQPVDIRRARFTSPGGRALELSLPSSGLGLSRWAFDSVLFSHAVRAGAHPHLRSDVRRVTRDVGGFLVAGADFEHPADLVVSAYGRKARLDHAFERAFVERAHPYLGFKQHHRPKAGEHGQRLAEELAGFVEIHGVDGGYCGMSFIEGGRINVCMLLEEGFFRGLAERSMPSILAELGMRNPALAVRLSALEPDGSEPLSVAQLSFETKERAKDDMLFLGDAAGMIAPLAGNGQAMVMESALLLAALIDERGVPRSATERSRLAWSWRVQWERKYRARIELDHHLQALLLRRTTSNRALTLLAKTPFVAGALVRLTRSGVRRETSNA